MRFIDTTRLILLAAIWGSSYIFMRVLSPAIGPVFTAHIRVVIAGLALVLYTALASLPLSWKNNWRHYLIIGAINSALPFSLFACAALYIPASCSVVLNATSPLFGTAFAIVWLNEQVTFIRIVGLLLGVCGVGAVSYANGLHMQSVFAASALICLSGAICYALSGIYIKKYASALKPQVLAAGSLVMAALLLIPVTALFAVPFLSITFTSTVIVSVLTLSLVCTALAYLLYFSLIRDIGPAKALTVSFLQPVFGIMWSVLLLGERVNGGMLLGCTLIMLGMLAIFKK